MPPQFAMDNSDILSEDMSDLRTPNYSPCGVEAAEFDYMAGIEIPQSLLRTPLTDRSPHLNLNPNMNVDSAFVNPHRTCIVPAMETNPHVDTTSIVQPQETPQLGTIPCTQTDHHHLRNAQLNIPGQDQQGRYNSAAAPGILGSNGHSADGREKPPIELPDAIVNAPGTYSCPHVFSPEELAAIMNCTLTYDEFFEAYVRRVFCPKLNNGSIINSGLGINAIPPTICQRNVSGSSEQQEKRDASQHSIAPEALPCLPRPNPPNAFPELGMAPSMGKTAKVEMNSNPDITSNQGVNFNAIGPEVQMHPRMSTASRNLHMEIGPHVITSPPGEATPHTLAAPHNPATTQMQTALHTGDNLFTGSAPRMEALETPRNCAPNTFHPQNIDSIESTTRSYELFTDILHAQNRSESIDPTTNPRMEINHNHRTTVRAHLTGEGKEQMKHDGAHNNGTRVPTIQGEAEGILGDLRQPSTGLNANGLNSNMQSEINSRTKPSTIYHPDAFQTNELQKKPTDSNADPAPIPKIQEEAKKISSDLRRLPKPGKSSSKGIIKSGGKSRFKKTSFPASEPKHDIANPLPVAAHLSGIDMNKLSEAHKKAPNRSRNATHRNISDMERSSRRTKSHNKKKTPVSNPKSKPASPRSGNKEQQTSDAATAENPHMDGLEFNEEEADKLDLFDENSCLLYYLEPVPEAAASTRNNEARSQEPLVVSSTTADTVTAPEEDKISGVPLAEIEANGFEGMCDTLYDGPPFPDPMHLKFERK